MLLTQGLPMLKIISPVLFLCGFYLGGNYRYVLLQLKCCMHWGYQWPWCMMYTFSVFISGLYCVCAVWDWCVWVTFYHVHALLHKALP